MELFEIGALEYDTLTSELDIPVYSKSPFLELNKYKVDKVHYLLGKDKRNRIALGIGEEKGNWEAPYSAPFSNIIPLRKDTTIENLYDFIKLIIDYVKKTNGKSISLFLPANIYGEQFNAKAMNALLGCGFNIKYEDINYSFDLNDIDLNKYDSTIHHNARKNLHIALKSDLLFERCCNSTEIEEAYEVIASNRASKGYPLRMSKDQVFKTLSIVNHDCFLVKNNGDSIASAIVYRITSNIAQVIYWGDRPGYTEYKPINFIAYQLISFYKDLGYRILDIGPSTEVGIPNMGLCNFKESIGCIPSAKVRFEIDV